METLRDISNFWSEREFFIAIFVELIWSKNYFSQVYWHKFGKNVINGVNLVKIGKFW